MNEQNLKPTTMLTESEVRELGKKGGIASGIARQKKRTFREIFNALRDETMQMKMPGGATEQLPLDVAAALAMFRKAANGDTKAMKLIADIVGEYEHNVNIKGDSILVVPEGTIEALDKWKAKK